MYTHTAIWPAARLVIESSPILGRVSPYHRSSSLGHEQNGIEFDDYDYSQLLQRAVVYSKVSQI